MLTNKLLPLQSTFLKHNLLSLDLQFFADPNDPPNDPPQDPPAPKMYDEDYVKKLRDEAAKYRTKAKELETNSQTQQQEMLNKVFTALGINPDPNLEFEKQLTAAQQAAQDAEKRANEKLIRAEVKSISADLNIIDAEAAYLFADKAAFSVKEDGSVEGVREALEKVIQEKPYLVTNPAEPKQNQYIPGPKQKGNEPKPADGYEAARERARQLLKK